MASRYDPGGIEAEVEPGSRGRVLRNRLGITRVRDMGLAESQALLLAQARMIEEYSAEHRFTAADVRRMHSLWLGPIYVWAGQYRQVNMGNGGFQFANAQLIPRLMADLERRHLARHTPSRAQPAEALAQALAIVHAELILIHPFREGNGRLARLLAVLMGLQAGLPPLDFTPLSGRNRARYIGAIHAAVGRDYAPLTALFTRVIERTQSA
jgi:cell filamentation protein